MKQELLNTIVAIQGNIILLNNNSVTESAEANIFFFKYLYVSELKDLTKQAHI